MLTMHGVTKPVVIDAAFLGAGPDLHGTIRAGFEGSTKVDRKEYGIVWNKTLDQGGTYLGDDVTISLQIEGVVPKPETASGKSEKKETTAKAGK
jgi:polyisoprenoid-binding protein YceI